MILKPTNIAGNRSAQVNGCCDNPIVLTITLAVIAHHLFLRHCGVRVVQFAYTSQRTQCHQTDDDDNKAIDRYHIAVHIDHRIAVDVQQDHRVTNQSMPTDTRVEVCECA
jgi:hypothetical protein